MTEQTIEGVVTWHMVSHLKNMVNKMRFEGKNIELFLGEGWISKPFSIKGDRDHVFRVYRALKQIAREDAE